MGPHSVLSRANKSLSAGDFESSLVDFLWIHNDSLKLNPEFIGVRNSFALHGFAKLSQVYPRAYDCLQEICIMNLDVLMSGESNLALFSETARIYQYLGLHSKVFDLIEQLATKFPGFADECREREKKLSQLSH